MVQLCIDVVQFNFQLYTTLVLNIRPILDHNYEHKIKMFEVGRKCRLLSNIQT
jgi:hypothetical protein